MGNLYSTVAEDAKQFNEMSGNENASPATGATPATPCPSGAAENNAKHQQVLGLIDPRSPSEGLPRTPLEIEERNRRIEKNRIQNLLLNKENNLFQSSLDMESVKTPTGPPKDGLLAFDPRSPNSEINRTPISYSNHGHPGRKMFQEQQ
ncbi:Cell division cycle-associated protein 3 [Orchesella cincta]|uniref:Cell division cycle-associated protein 3 n=1 Tax=Orchesella cincta TaxID=48709 RepID=A0A1D2MK80_ORCCI|nr:Cell division cycle-associated protein 3 [Orchesella cincta]